MKKSFINIFVLNAYLFLSSCATTIDAFYSANADKISIKSVYLVNKSAESTEMTERIRSELEKRKLKVIVGPDIGKTSQQDAIIKFDEEWKKEVTNNLQELNLIIFDKNGELASSAHWKNAKFNVLTSVSSVINDCLDSLFEKIKIVP